MHQLSFNLEIPSLGNFKMILKPRRVVERVYTKRVRNCQIKIAKCAKEFNRKRKLSLWWKFHILFGIGMSLLQASSIWLTPLLTYRYWLYLYVPKLRKVSSCLRQTPLKVTEIILFFTESNNKKCECQRFRNKYKSWSTNVWPMTKFGQIN